MRKAEDQVQAAKAGIILPPLKPKASPLDRIWTIIELTNADLIEVTCRVPPDHYFCIDRKHAKHLEERFTEAGVACEYVDGNVPMFERQDNRSLVDYLSNPTV